MNDDVSAQNANSRMLFAKVRVSAISERENRLIESFLAALTRLSPDCATILFFGKLYFGCRRRYCSCKLLEPRRCVDSAHSALLAPTVRKSHHELSYNRLWRELANIERLIKD